MKHVFVIGSHSPYLTALGVIDHLKLDKKDILFIWGRNYQCIFHDAEIESYDLSDLYVIYFRNNTLKNIKDCIVKIDDFITDKIGTEYVLYIPLLNFPFMQIWATNIFCRDIKFIQEGIIDFCSRKRESLINCFFNTFYLQSNRVWKADNWNTELRLKNKTISETFAITDKLFQEIDCKHTIVKWPICKLNYTLNPDSSFFLFESAVEMKLVEKDIFIDSIKKMIRKYGRTINYIKFHPFQSEQNKETIKQLFIENGLEYSEMPNDIPFELVLASYKNLNIYGFTTSLVFFAQLMGHNAISCCKLLLRSKTFQKYWDNFSWHLRSYGDDYFNITDL